MSDHDKLTDELGHLKAEYYDRIEQIKRGEPVTDEQIAQATLPKMEMVDSAELRALRKLRDDYHHAITSYAQLKATYDKLREKVEPVLRRYLFGHATDLRNPSKCHCDNCSQARDILARHFGKEEGK